MKNIRKNIEIRRFVEWSKIVRGKPIQIRLYELIYFELLNLWIELKQPPLRRLIYETINSNTYDEKFIQGKIFQEYINEILETPCEDKSGYYNPDSREGIKHKILPAMCVQYHPEASPGPHDSRYLFDEFLNMIKRNKK